jgi:hypothetical protein
MKYAACAARLVALQGTIVSSPEVWPLSLPLQLPVEIGFLSKVHQFLKSDIDVFQFVDDSDQKQYAETHEKIVHHLTASRVRLFGSGYILAAGIK